MTKFDNDDDDNDDDDDDAHFLSLDQKHPFDQIWSKNPKLFGLRWCLVKLFKYRLISIRKFWWCCSPWASLVQKLKIVCQRGNLVPTLIQICRVWF